MHAQISYKQVHIHKMKMVRYILIRPKELKMADSPVVFVTIDNRSVSSNGGRRALRWLIGPTMCTTKASSSTGAIPQYAFPKSEAGS